MKIIYFCATMERKYNTSIADTDLALINAAKQAALTAYAPYSHFNVGAAVLLSDGRIVKGSNQENKAYGSCVCAERVALLYATANYSATPPVAIAICAMQNGTFVAHPVTPCGECRQVLMEMQTRFQRPIKTIMYGEDYCYIAEDASELLPASF